MKRYRLLFIGIACLIAGIFALVALSDLQTTPLYSGFKGETVFWSEDTFQDFKEDFKQAVVTQDAKWEMYIVSSEPPILVNFDINKLPLDYTFPYGAEYKIPKADEHQNLLIATILGTIFGLSAGIVLLIFWHEDTKTSKHGGGK
jgi:hypothetical protein